jgi:hypothetical protein
VGHSAKASLKTKAELRHSTACPICFSTNPVAPFGCSPLLVRKGIRRVDDARLQMHFVRVMSERAADGRTTPPCFNLNLEKSCAAIRMSNSQSSSLCARLFNFRPQTSRELRPGLDARHVVPD